MQKIQAEQGFVVVAVNSDSTDYVACARQLAASLHAWNADAKVCLISDREHQAPEFDHQIQLPWGDQDSRKHWKLSNDWQVWNASPYRQTIKLEADMLICGPIDHWWSMCQHRDVCISTGARDFYDRPALSRFYRRTFDNNNLPDVYNAIVYWRRSKTAQEFWSLCRQLFENWNQIRTLLKFSEADATTDVIYAIAAVILGPETVTMPWASYPKIVHMKKHMIGCATEDWTKELVWEYHNHCLSVQTVRQWGAFHYNIKTWRAND